MREAMGLDAYAALRSRNYRLLLTGHLLSHLGLQHGFPFWSPGIRKYTPICLVWSR